MTHPEDERVWSLVVAITGTILAITLLLLGVLACGGPPPPRPPVAVTLERRTCLAERPPEPPGGLIFEACPDSNWAICVSKENAIVLLSYLTRLRRYAADAWDACGPLDPEVR